MTRLAPLLAVLTLLACSKGGAGAGASPAPGAVKVEFFVMSQCPFGVQVEKGVQEALEALGPMVDYQVDYIGAEQDGRFVSLHGPDEVTGDLAQLCLKAKAPGALVPFLACQNQNPREVARSWDACAREVKAPVDQVKACLEGPEGQGLLRASFARAAARGAASSPTMFIGGKPYSGRRGSADFMRAICQAYPAEKPAPCQKLPEPPRVAVTVLSDARCADCKTDRLVGMLTSQLANPAITQLDYATPEGKKAYDALPGAAEGLALPLVLFDRSLAADGPAQAHFAKYLHPLGDWQSLKVGASYLPACADPGGCALPRCQKTLGCRAETPNTLELFVMSQCPYGVKALDSMAEVLKSFSGSPLKFSVNYIASGSAEQGFRSLHGPAEVEEDMRELCAMKKYPQGAKYMDYVLCRNKDLKAADWERCATGGLDARVIKACAEGPEGKALLEESLSVAGGLGIGASPTWLANGRHRFAALDAESIRRNLCQHNPTLKGCEKTLSTGAAPPAGQCAQ